MGVHLDGSTVVEISRLDVIEGPSGRRWRNKAERARIAAESLMPGVTVAGLRLAQEVADGAVGGAENIATLPAFAELVVEVPPDDSSPSGNLHDIVEIRAGADQGLLRRMIHAARAAMP